MPATIVDSSIFGDIFSAQAMRGVWSDENRTQKYLDIEAALARARTARHHSAGSRGRDRQALQAISTALASIEKDALAMRAALMKELITSASRGAMVDRVLASLRVN